MRWRRRRIRKREANVRRWLATVFPSPSHLAELRTAEIDHKTVASVRHGRSILRYVLEKGEPALKHSDPTRLLGMGA